MNVRYRAASMMIDDVVPLNSKGVNSLFWIDVCVDIYKLLMITVSAAFWADNILAWLLLLLCKVIKSLLEIPWANICEGVTLIPLSAEDYPPLKMAHAKNGSMLGGPVYPKMSHLLSSTFTS